MNSKYIAAVVTLLTLASSDLAFAKTKQHAPVQSYNACDPYAGTYWEGVAPYASNARCDPLKGTVFDDVAPY